MNSELQAIFASHFKEAFPSAPPGQIKAVPGRVPSPAMLVPGWYLYARPRVLGIYGHNAAIAATRVPTFTVFRELLWVGHREEIDLRRGLLLDRISVAGRHPIGFGLTTRPRVRILLDE